MSKQLTTDDFTQSLNAHVAAKGLGIYESYGPCIRWTELLQILGDRSVVRYPCEVVFEADPLLDGEFAYPKPNGQDPAHGFTIYVHPQFRDQLEWVPHLVLYQLVRVNYGEFASAEDAETFGASALGLSRDEYYAILCRLADGLQAGHER
jgi:hypothetical protein